jgi:hypothetical protein
MKQHKWHKEIIHWANGGTVQHFLDKWYDWDSSEESPSWDVDNEYRIKPQPKEPQYLYVYKMMTNEGLKIQFWDSKSNYESYIGKIKLEVDDETN